MTATMYCIYSVKESQYVVLKKLKMKEVFKVLKLLVKWMRLGMYEFFSLPFATKWKCKKMTEPDCAVSERYTKVHVYYLMYCVPFTHKNVQAKALVYSVN